MAMKVCRYRAVNAEGSGCRLSRREDRHRPQQPTIQQWQGMATMKYAHGLPAAGSAATQIWKASLRNGLVGRCNDEGFRLNTPTETAPRRWQTRTRSGQLDLSQVDLVMDAALIDPGMITLGDSRISRSPDCPGYPATPTAGQPSRRRTGEAGRCASTELHHHRHPRPLSTALRPGHFDSTAAILVSFTSAQRLRQETPKPRRIASAAIIQKSRDFTARPSLELMPWRNNVVWCRSLPTSRSARSKPKVSPKRTKA